MIRLAIFVVILHAVIAGCKEQQTVYLPPESEFVTIVGNGFKLQVQQLDKFKKDWGAVVKDSAEMKEPPSKADEEFVSNDISAKNSNSKRTSKNYGFMSKNLEEWINLRAKALAARVERYSNELVKFKKPQRVVAQVLMLNTLVDLDDLNKENIKSLKWMKKKLRIYERSRTDYLTEVEKWVLEKMVENQKIEKSVKGKNNPGERWMSNMKAIKRVDFEQRFSEVMDEMVVNFLKDKFGGMERSRVYDLFKSDKKTDDGLYYQGALGRIPTHFPFSAQDAILNEA